MVYRIVKKAFENGLLKEGSYVVEATSGNTGIAFSFFSTLFGYKFVAVMPEFASKERAYIMKHYGAEVILTPSELGVRGAVEAAEKIGKKLGAFMPRQFENEENVKAMEELGVEIANQIRGIDAFVAGVGTGGTLIGVARVLKKIDESIKIVAVEPEESPILSEGKAFKHEIEGIGEDFVPKIFERNRKLVDEIVKVSSRDAIKTARNLAKHGFFVGISSGANVYAAKILAEEGNKVVTIMPDRADRYYSTSLFTKDLTIQDEKLKEVLSWL